MLNVTYSHEVTIKLYEELELYPNTAPYEEGYLQVSDQHRLYYAQFGNPDGVPVLVVHGGPGFGCSPAWSSFFDLAFYRVIMFDQRGSARSTPAGEMNDNTPQHSVADMEALRVHLGVDKWLLFGGSWGSALSILYGETHPERVTGFVLRGVFLARQKDYEHLYYGMKRTFPDAWDEMVQVIPEEERTDLIKALYNRVMDPDPQVHLPVAHAFMRYDAICGTLLPNPALLDHQSKNDHSVINVTRAFMHYSINHFFMEEDQLLNDLDKIAHLPAIIVQGRYDMICLPEGAYELYKKWNNANLWFVADGAHFSSEPSIAKGLKEAMDQMKPLINP